MPKHAGGTEPGKSPASRQSSAGMRSELQTNQTVLAGLSNWYSVFAFTGGAVPSGHCELAAVNCLSRASLCDRLHLDRRR